MDEQQNFPETGNTESVPPQESQESQESPESQVAQQPQQQEPQAPQQQPAASQQPQQSYAAPQQPYAPPQAPQPQPAYYIPSNLIATEAQKEAVFKTAGGVVMLLLAIGLSINLAVSLFVSFPFSIFSCILPLFTVIGVWILYANARKKQFNTTGIKFIKVPFIIQFVLSMIGMAFAIIIVVIMFIALFAAGAAGAGAAGSAAEGETVANTVTIASAMSIVFIPILIALIISLVFQILYFNSINGCLNDGLMIMRNNNPARKAPGMFAAVLIFISAALSTLPSVGYSILSMVFSAEITQYITDLFTQVDAPKEIIDAILSVFNSIGVTAVVSGIITFLYQILSGVLLVQYVSRRKN